MEEEGIKSKIIKKIKGKKMIGRDDRELGCQFDFFVSARQKEGAINEFFGFFQMQQG
jgi:hypothetical protein